MDPYYKSDLVGEECEDPRCHGCQRPIEDGSVVQFGDGIWHFECFRCAKCHKLVECYSNLLLLRDGSPICEDCSYSCHACSKTIKDEAIMTGDEAYHADCFRCVECNKKIDDLVFTQTSKGIFCTKCHEARKQSRLKKKNKQQQQQEPPANLFRNSSTTSIVNAYAQDDIRTPILELNDMLGQRSSEETLRNSLDVAIPNESSGEQLRQELIETKTRLKEVESKLIKIKAISRKVSDEYHIMKDGYAAETDTRREAENTIYRLKSQVSFYQQASLSKSSEQVVQSTKEDIEELEECKTNLELVCHHLRMERDELVTELSLHSKNIEKLLASQKPKELHWERLQQAYQQQLDSMSRDMEVARTNYAKMVKTREEIISDMILLNTKNAELSQLNNDLSRRVMEREQEAKAFFSGTNFLSPPQEDDELKPPFSATSTIQSTGKHHRRNLSTGSIGMTSSNSVDIKATMDSFAASTQKLAQRDSFNGSAAPKLFKFRRNRSNSGKRPKVSLDALDQKETENTTVRKSGSHHFAQAKFIRPTKCEACGEKMWRVSELKCSECHVVCHSKCMYSVPQACYRKTSLDSLKSDQDLTRHMFGNDLVKQVQAEKSKIPLVVEKCIEAVEARGLDYEGIYRKSGGVGQMRQIQQTFEKGETPSLTDEEKWNDICAVTSVLKQYFRELPNPLFTYELHAKFMDAIAIQSTTEQLQAMSQLIQTLPIENFNTLKYLMEHLDRIQQRNKENLMTAKNLSVIFGPTLLRHRDENRDLLEMNLKIRTIEYILNHIDKMFVIETIKSSTENRRVHLPPLQRGEDLSSILSSYDAPSVADNSAFPAVPPRENAGYI